MQNSQNTQVLLSCRSLTYAQRSTRVLERAGITATVSRLPRSVSERGCGYCVIVAPRHLDRALERLSAAGLSPKRVFIRDADGIREAAEHDLS